MKLMVFSHGKDSSPNSTKIQRLLPIAKELGYMTLVLDYTSCVSVEERVAVLGHTLEGMVYDSLFLVGSSMGGYVSLAHANKNSVQKMLLLCPAVYLPNYPTQEFTPNCEKIVVVHGWQDEIVPVDNVISFAKRAKANLHLLDDNHRLSSSLDFIEQQFETLFK